MAIEVWYFSCLNEYCYLWNQNHLLYYNMKIILFICSLQYKTTLLNKSDKSFPKKHVFEWMCFLTCTKNNRAWMRHKQIETWQCLRKEDGHAGCSRKFMNEIYKSLQKRKRDMLVPKTSERQWTNMVRQLDWGTNRMMMRQLTLFALTWLLICGRITLMENLGLFVVRHYLTTCLLVSLQTHAHILLQRTLPTVTPMNPTLPIFCYMKKWRRLHWIRSWMRIT